MAIPNYGALVGTVIDKLDSPSALRKNPGSKPHYQILVEADGVKYRIAVNVKSNQQPSDLQFYLDDHYVHPVLNQIKDLPVGFSELHRAPNSGALDYIRENLFNFNDLLIVPSVLGGPNNDLNDIFDVHTTHAMNTPNALVYAFGAKWGPEDDKKDQYFDFLPGNGIHDIHMNQGNVGSFARDNGVYQDGGLFFYFPDEDRWVAMFLKFQSQAVHTNDNNAEPIEHIAEPVLVEDSDVKIISALINPKGDDVSKEFIYLINKSDKDIDLDGWMVADRLKKKEVIHNINLKAAEVRKISLSGLNAQLSNQGGIITLLNKDGIKVDGVSYTKKDIQKEGHLVVF
jgi:uncharacterized protein YukJ